MAHQRFADLKTPAFGSQVLADARVEDGGRLVRLSFSSEIPVFRNTPMGPAYEVWGMIRVKLTCSGSTADLPRSSRIIGGTWTRWLGRLFPPKSRDAEAAPLCGCQTHQKATPARTGGRFRQHRTPPCVRNLGLGPQFQRAGQGRGNRHHGRNVRGCFPVFYPGQYVLEKRSTARRTRPHGPSRYRAGRTVLLPEPCCPCADHGRLVASRFRAGSLPGVAGADWP